MNHPILVLAGNYQQARQWARDSGIAPRDWRYIGTPASLRGYRNPIVAKVGTFYERRDVAEFEECLALCSLGGKT